MTIPVPFGSLARKRASAYYFDMGSLTLVASEANATEAAPIMPVPKALNRLLRRPCSVYVIFQSDHVGNMHLHQKWI